LANTLGWSEEVITLEGRVEGSWRREKEEGWAS